jgi:hypothetical protein
MSQSKAILDKDLPIWLPRMAVRGGAMCFVDCRCVAGVVDGSRKPGDHLPPQRQWTAQQDVDLTTITCAYDAVRRFKNVSYNSTVICVRPPRQQLG